MMYSTSEKVNEIEKHMNEQQQEEEENNNSVIIKSILYIIL